MRSRCAVLTLTALGLLCAARAAAQDPGAAQGGPAPPSQPAAEGRKVRLTFDERPSIEIGTIARVDFRVSLQGDVRRSDAAGPFADSGLSWARKRIGLHGDVAGLFTFQIEREFEEAEPWRDVYLNYEQFEVVEVRAGRFKMPFGLDENTAISRLDFVYRARLADELSPGRDRGVMVHGRVFDRLVQYEVGVFAGPGENTTRTRVDLVRAGSTAAARLIVRPLRHLDATVDDLTVGVAATWGDVPEGFPALRGQTAFGDEFYEPDLWVKGRERRVGFEARWRPGPFAVKTEYVRLTEERRGQSVEDTDLSPLLSTGWYVSGSWAVTGERKADGLESPRRPITAGGPGAIELAFRVEALEFGSVATGDAPSFSPRADVIFGNRLGVTTVGVNWHPMRWFRVQLNFIRESLAVPVEGLPAQPAWGRVLRFQFAM